MSETEEHSCKSGSCCEKIRSELHYSKFGLRCEDQWESFHYCPVSFQRFRLKVEYIYCTSKLRCNVISK